MLTSLGYALVVQTRFEKKTIGATNRGDLLHGHGVFDGACVCFLPRRHGQSHPSGLLGRPFQHSRPHVLDRPIRVFTQIRDSDVTSGLAEIRGKSPREFGTT
jgi:hypothetical protein